KVYLYPARFVEGGRHSNVLQKRGSVGVRLGAAVLVLVWAPGALADQPSKLYKEGRKAERAGEMARAFLLYSQAAALAPGKNTYWLRSQAVRTRAALQSRISLPTSESDATPARPDAPQPDQPITAKD